jgi:glycerol-1-phosphate dehydrogenase [NAD(P)+]
MSFLQDLLGRLDANGTLACTCGAEHRIAVGEVLVGDDALARSAELLYRRHGANPAVWVLSDENTEAAAGERWKAAAPGANIRSRVLPAVPRPVPSLELAQALAGEVLRAPADVLVGVGGGVVSDLVKRVSFETGVPSWCIATSPSVDAYSSGTAALHTEGYHKALPARASEVIVCDLDVLARAPRILFLAGLGDLLAKLVANLDWNVAHLVADHPFCATIADFALGAAREAIAAARALEIDPGAATRSLTDAILVSGFAMQAIGSSRPAASAEHSIAHLWESVDRGDTSDFHGILVGAATALILPGYLELYRRVPDARPDVASRLAAYRDERPWDEALEEAMRPYAANIDTEMRGRHFDGAVLARRLEAFVRERGRIAALADGLLAELSDAVRLLGELGFPSLDDLGIAGDQRLLPVRHVRILRNRYTSFDLAYELGIEPAMVGSIAAAL